MFVLSWMIGGYLWGYYESFTDIVTLHNNYAALILKYRELIQSKEELKLTVRLGAIEIGSLWSDAYWSKWELTKYSHVIVSQDKELNLLRDIIQQQQVTIADLNNSVQEKIGQLNDADAFKQRVRLGLMYKDMLMKNLETENLNLTNEIVNLKKQNLKLSTEIIKLKKEILFYKKD